MLVLVAACGTDPPEAEFAFVGEVRDSAQASSTIGLFVVPGQTTYYKLGDGSTALNQFDLVFRREPPAEALAAGTGVALVGLLPGLATIADGPVEPGLIRLTGISTDHAVIFKAPGATEPAWIQGFDDGFSCGRCIREPAALDTFEPISCSFVVVQAFGTDVCAWF